MIRVGIAGLGFMGTMHFRCYNALENTKVTAICDIDKKKFSDTKGTAGNIGGAEKPLDLSGIGLYTDFGKMLAEANLDAVSITLPTYLHTEFTVKTLKAGINVLCEKPMAMNVRECRQMMDVARRSRKLLQIGHCIRFWPEYAKTKEIIDSGEYGKVLSATFQRLSLTPTWSWDNWLLDGTRSGGAALDMHIHDSDYIQYVFGMPREVFSRGAIGPSGDVDHIVTNYIYDGKVVTAEGGWAMAPKFGFEMSFNIAIEKATIVYNCTQSPAFKICPFKGDVIVPKVKAGDGYSLEIAHFVKRVAGKSVPTILTPAQSCDSIKLIEAEKKSARSGKKAIV